MKLDEMRYEAGRTILKLADDLGFATKAAGWLYVTEGDDEDGEWRLYLITPMIDEQGPRWIYDRLLKVFAKVGMPEGITPLDVYVAGPNDGLFRLLENKMEIDGPGRVEFSDHKIDGITIPYALFYRIKSGRVSTKPQLFDARVKQILAA